MLQYGRLDPSKSEIRVLTIQGGRRDDDIQCTLQTVSLDDPPEFAALSYVWGETSLKRPITVDGKIFDVPENLDEGLRAFRKRRKPRTLWVDYICINQADVEEKNTQVPLMGRLYSTAPSVLVWLGPSTRNIELAISWAQAYVAKWHCHSSAYWLKLKVKAKFSKTAKRKRDTAVLGALEGYLEITGLPYWNRMWTYQEFQLPSEEPRCCCGRISFRPSTVFGEAETAINQAGSSAITSWLDSFSNPDPANWSEKDMKQFDEMQAFKGRLGAKKVSIESAASALLKDKDQNWRNSDSPLLYLMVTSADRQCSVIHDKVYALHGMVPEAQKANPPDYRKSFRDVILETAAYLVNHEQALSMWNQFGLRDDRLSNIPTYPSWMPDFTNTDLNGPNLHRQQSGYVVGYLRLRKETPAARIELNRTTLHLWARNLGRVTAAFQFKDTQDAVIDQLRLLIRKPSTLLGADAAQRLRKPETVVSRMGYICCSHTAEQTEYTKMIDILLHKDLDSPDVDGEKVRHPARTLANKVFFVVENGYFGIGVRGIKAGDILTIPPQVANPVVLAKESSSSSDTHYRMVGTAVVDGVMEGKLLDPGVVAEVRAQPIEEFIIG